MRHPVITDALASIDIQLSGIDRRANFETDEGNKRSGAIVVARFTGHTDQLLPSEAIQYSWLSRIDDQADEKATTPRMMKVSIQKPANVGRLMSHSRLNSGHEGDRDLSIFSILKYSAENISDHANSAVRDFGDLMDVIDRTQEDLPTGAELHYRDVRWSPDLNSSRPADIALIGAGAYWAPVLTPDNLAA